MFSVLIFLAYRVYVHVVAQREKTKTNKKKKKKVMPVLVSGTKTLC